MKNWFKISLLLIIVLAIGGAFYWYELRPIQIKKECIEKYQFAFLNGDEGSLAKSDEINYKKCLVENGL